MAKYRLEEIVKEYLIEIGDAQMNRFARYYQFAVSGIREWNMDMTGIPKTVELEISHTDTVNLPTDYLNYVMIGIVGNDNIVYPLGENNRLSLANYTDACGNEIRQRGNSEVGAAIITNPISYVADHFRNGEIMGRFFGIGGGQNTNGYFRIDETANQIKLNGLICSVASVYLEYIADITADIDGDFMVHPFMLETLKAWIYWKSIERDRNFSLGEKAMAKDSYMQARRVSRTRISSKPLSEWYRAVRAGNSAAVKF